MKRKQKTRRFLIIIENVDGRYIGYSPDLPGCEGRGKTHEEARHNISSAIGMYVNSLVESKSPVPKPHSFAEYVDVTA